MGNVLQHSQSSAKTFGGQPEDYVPIHKFLDVTKLLISDWRHRALLHNTMGVLLCEQFFGDTFRRPSDGELVCTRTIAEQHIKEDLGFIPTPADWLKEMPIRTWMGGATRKQVQQLQNQTIPDDLEFEAVIKQALSLASQR